MKKVRKFKCISTREVNIHCWSDYFTYGKVYELVEEKEHSILKMIDDEGDTLAVDCSCFEEVFDEE